MKRTILSLFTTALLTATLASCDGNGADADETSTAGSPAAADSANESKFDDTKMEDDAEWTASVAQGNMIEGMLGKYATTNAASPAVKELGKTLEADHRAMNDELAALAAQKNITVPTTLSEKMKERHDDIIAKKGADFDKAFMDEVVKDHEMMIDHFKDQADDGKDADLKAFATKHVGHLEEHLAKAKSVRDGLK